MMQVLADIHMISQCSIKAQSEQYNCSNNNSMGLYLINMQGFVYCYGLEKVKLFKLQCIILVSFDLHDRLTWPTQN